MKLHHLRPAPGSTTARTRKGRGEAAGKGKTAGRGTKGSNARGKMRVGFEGGQMPLQRRVPKLKGFINPNKVRWSVVNVERLAEGWPKGGSIATGTQRSPTRMLPGRRPAASSVAPISAS